MHLETFRESTFALREEKKKITEDLKEEKSMGQRGSSSCPSQR
jgi:hypothetical protein